jgi:hypothetical protein
VAEAAAFAALSRWGIDPGKYSPYYVAHWARDPEVLRRNLGEVGRVARTMIGAIEGEEPGEAREWL